MEVGVELSVLIIMERHFRRKSSLINGKITTVLFHDVQVQTSIASSRFFKNINSIELSV